MRLPLGNSEVLMIEEFNENDREFLNQKVRPYFKTIFSDIAMRRHSPKKTEDELEFIDKVAFFEYTNLPGYINDRFFSLFEKSSDEHIYERGFVDGMIRVYMSTIDERMKLTFQMYVTFKLFCSMHGGKGFQSSCL